MRAVIAGGGTAGHLYPGLAVADILRERGWEILFIGTASGPEARIVPLNGYEFRPLEVIGRGRGVVSRRNALAVLKLCGAAVRCVRILKRFRPQVVVGTGGYASLPAAFAAAAARVPLVLHEQNSVPGLANRVARRFAARVGVSFPGSEASFGNGAVLVGNPVRSALRSFDRQALRPRGLEAFGLSGERPTLLVFGGSQGARRINETVSAAYDRWRGSSLQVLHLAGPGKAEATARAVQAQLREGDTLLYKVLGYTDEMELAYACSDLALCRAGASTIAELASAGLPAILVPLPVSLDDDQRRNAEAVVRAGGGTMVLDAHLTPELVARTVEEMLRDRDALESMARAIHRMARPDAAERFARLVLEAASGLDC